MNEVIKHIRNVFIDKAINPEASFTKSMNRMSMTSLKKKKSCYTDIETIVKKQNKNNKRDTVAVNEKVINNNEKIMNKKDEVMNNNDKVMNGYVYKVVPAETEGCCYGCWFWSNNDGCHKLPDSTIDCKDGIIKKVPYTTENKKDEKVMNIFDYKLIEGDGTCNGCCFYDEDKDMCDDICSFQCMDCGTSNIYIAVPKQTQLKYATNQGNVSATMDLLPPYDNLELEKVGITDNNQLTIYWKEKSEYLPDWNDLLNDKDINIYIVPIAVTDKHNKSMVAFAKISQLMPYYGGEADMSSSGYIVIYNKDKDSMNVHQISSVALRKCIFPVFKTKESAQKFILKPDNAQLIKDLYMI